MAQRAVTGSLALGAGEALARLVAFGTTVYLARTLGPDTYGVVAVAAGLMLYLTQIADAGVELAGMTDAASGPDRASAVVRGALGVRLRLTAVLLLVVVPVGLWLLPRPDGPVLALYALGLPAAAVSVRWIYLGLQRPTVVAVSRITGDVVTLAATLVLVRAPGDVYGAPLAVLAGGAVAAAVLLRGLPALGVSLHAATDRAGVAAMLARGRRLVAFTLLGLLLYNVDLIILRYLAGEAAAGQYAAAYVLISFCANLMVAYSHTVLPALAGDAPPTAATAATYATALVTACVLTLPVAVGGALIAPLLVQIVFGPQYAAAATALGLLVLAVPVGALREVAVAALIARRREPALLRVNLVAVVVNLSLIAALVPPFGLAGAAAATVASEVVRLGVALAAAGTAIPGRLPIGRLAACLAAGAGMGGAIVLTGVRGSLVAVVVGGVVYPALLALLGLLKVTPDRRIHLGGA